MGSAANHLNELKIVETSLDSVIDGQTHRSMMLEYMIDGRPLCELLNLTRDFSTCGTGIDGGHDIDAFLGDRPASNQFGSGRLVLYRCHCGCDYCGVVSCALEIEDHKVTWSKIAFETDNASGTLLGDGRDILGSSLITIARIEFGHRQYAEALQRLRNQ